MTPLDRAFCVRDAPVVAPDLLNKVLQVVDAVDGVMVSGRIVEVEAYMSDDPASHTYRGRTPRNTSMFAEGGHAYVYTSYGIHRCLNVVSGPAEVGQGVLIRAVTPIEGLDEIRRRRGGRRDRELTDGPGKVGQALGITTADDGVDLLDPSSRLQLFDDGVAPPASPRIGPRVGLTKGVDTPWRFRIP